MEASNGSAAVQTNIRRLRLLSSGAALLLATSLWSVAGCTRESSSADPTASAPVAADAGPLPPSYIPPPPPPPPPAIVRFDAPGGRYSLDLPEDWTIREGQGNIAFIAAGALQGTPAECLLREATAAPESAFQRDAIEGRLRRLIPNAEIRDFGSAPLGSGSARRVRWWGSVGGDSREGAEYLRNISGRHLAFECSSDQREKMVLAYERFDAMAASLRFGN
jgi:hypothetical protein